MTASDRAALPAGGVETTGGVPYLTLTYRQNAATTGLAVQLQASTNLQSGWNDITPDIGETLGSDPVTGDPIHCLKVNITGQPRKFIRLKITTP